MEIKTDLHTHTMASSHAYSTLKENAECAKSAGLEAIAITDHAPSMPDAPHPWHFSVLATSTVPRKVCGGKVVLIKGVECSYLNSDAELDLEENILKKLDIVIASVHSPTYAPKTSEEHTKMLLQAMENPYIDILGHIDRVSCGADYDLVAKTAAQKGKVIELNEHSLNKGKTLERTTHLLRACKKHGTMICVNSDAHYCELVGRYPISTELLQSLDFDERLIINKDLKQLENFLNTKGKSIL